MSVAAYTRDLPGLKLPELLTRAEFVRDAMEAPGWGYVLEAISAHEQKMLARLLNESTKPEDIPYLRGLLAGLKSMREASESILEHAADREAEARARLAQEHANV